MSLQLGETAPDFTLDSTAGTIHFSDYARDHWVVFFSHPKDFTPICTTELGAFAHRKAEFDRRHVKLLGLSVDPVEQHKAWGKDISDVAGTTLNYPILADPDLEVAKLYGMYHPKADPKVTVRSVFFIDPQRKVRTTFTYPPSVGRNIDEILRTLDALQVTDKQPVATPVDWKPGDDVVVSPTLSDAEAEKQFGKLRIVKPYLRYAKVKTA
ncbi:MAG: peroxiredoxin [Rhodanobacter sp.]|nr:MAG: peroxiredoxin [Rhodanobacter sp.]TAM07161.1 MAG: peroxiredoxin [Rhodanobacter sp.]TAM43096.1 MAG: peroxiredoxin [Rhodanobacter sp.]